MISRGEDVEAQALKNRGWSTSAIARHLGRDRKTIRAYLSGQREAGVRRSSVPDPLEPYRAYLVARFADNAHIWASALFDEVVALGYGQSYVSFARQLRLAGLRPHCEACAGVTGRETIEIEHPPGEETLCGFPHKISYVARENMRRRARRGSVPNARGGGLCRIFTVLRGRRGARRVAGIGLGVFWAARSWQWPSL
jgi:hypothetical protein